MTPRLRFFGGKGGVGKTTCAVTAAKASRGRVLVISTDPAHSLGDALETRLSQTPKRVGRIDALELNADCALDEWLRQRRDGLRTIALRGTYFDEEDVDRFLGLSLPGVDELVGLVEIARLLRSERWDEVIIDTAPTGHTLRLLAMPHTLSRIGRVLDDMQEKHRVMAAALGGGSRRDQAEALIAEIAGEAQALTEMVRAAEFSWVLLPEALSIEETRDGLTALHAQGIPIAELVINNVTPPGPRCDLCDARRREESKWIASARKLATAYRIPGVRIVDAFPPPKKSSAPRLPVKCVSVDAPADLRLLVFGGKGGTGKTTCAAACAIAIADRHSERRILLLSTDPAHSLGDALDLELGDDERTIPGGPPNLHVRELDAAAAFERQRARYRDAIDELFDAIRGGSRFDATLDRRIVHDLIDLAPPGIDELFAILTVTDALPQYELVILDTAPTGHALRLLELPAAAHEWVRALLRVLVKYQGALGLGPLAQDLVDLARSLRELRSLLGNADRARFVAVTRAAALPRAETQRLIERLPLALSAIIVNALTPPGCSRCDRASAAEAAEIAALGRLRPRAILRKAAMVPPPRGLAALRRFGQSFAQS